MNNRHSRKRWQPRPEASPPDRQPINIDPEAFKEVALDVFQIEIHNWSLDINDEQLKGIAERSMVATQFFFEALHNHLQCYQTNNDSPSVDSSDQEKAFSLAP